jgi:hypothetical protein
MYYMDDQARKQGINPQDYHHKVMILPRNYSLNVAGECLASGRRLRPPQLLLLRMGASGVIGPSCWPLHCTLGRQGTVSLNTAAAAAMPECMALRPDCLRPARHPRFPTSLYL